MENGDVVVVVAEGAWESVSLPRETRKCTFGMCMSGALAEDLGAGCDFLYKSRL